MKKIIIILSLLTLSSCSYVVSMEKNGWTCTHKGFFDSSVEKFTFHTMKEATDFCIRISGNKESKRVVRITK